MNGDEILDLIGRPAGSAQVRKFLTIYELNTPETFSDSAWSREHGVSVEFSSRVYYERYYESAPEADSSATGHAQERIANEITFESYFTGTLPGGLSFRDGLQAFIKVGKRLTKDIEEETGRQIYRMLTDRHVVMVSADQGGQVQFIRYWPVEKKIRKMVNRKAEIKRQDQHIQADAAGRIDGMKSMYPALIWIQRMKAGDESFSEKSIYNTQQLLERYLSDLTLAAESHKASSVVKAVKNVVSGLNKLNHKYHHIDTLEREELCIFITKAAKATGYQIDDSEDITEEWREW